MCGLSKINVFIENIYYKYDLFIVSAVEMYKNITYITSPQYLAICDKHPKTSGRASLVHSLIEAYDLLPALNIVAPVKSSVKDLTQFHTEDYVNRIKRIQDSFYEDLDSEEANEEKLEDYGLGYDCAVFAEIYDYISYVAGASLTAANILLQHPSSAVINLNGGWHHAHVDEAAGFCYVNDVVICILKLLKSFQRVLYVDLDIHHGDGVEEAFKYSKKVMTFSIHKHNPGFFPGTGGNSLSKHYCVNVPLNDGITDDKYIFVFQTLFSKALEVFQPDAIVCQCGADCLSGDPLGGFNLTSRALKSCIQQIASTKTPLLLLGGGGYHTVNTARCWTEVIACLCAKSLTHDIPEHDDLCLYKPDYALQISASNRKDENTHSDIQALVANILNVLENCQKIKSANKDLTDTKSKTNYEDDNIVNPIMDLSYDNRIENQYKILPTNKKEFPDETWETEKKVLTEKNK